MQRLESVGINAQRLSFQRNKIQCAESHQAGVRRFAATQLEPNGNLGQCLFNSPALKPRKCCTGALSSARTFHQMFICLLSKVIARILRRSVFTGF
jgi:hypothetical protein